MLMAAPKIVFVLGLASFIVASAVNGTPQFGYVGSVGPDHWSSLNPAWMACSIGTHQSPIKIVKGDVVYDSSLKALEKDYFDANATLVNNGFNVELLYEECGGNLEIDGKNYSLVQMHWHSPSEHTIDGQRYPFEEHIVHKSQDGQISVVAILYRLGHANTFLSQLKDGLEALAKEKYSEDEEAHIPVGIVKNKALNRVTRKYYRYVGSLTTPPCTENVIWTIFGKVREMSEEQAAALKAPLASVDSHNARPTQPLNGRIVEVYHRS